MFVSILSSGSVKYFLVTRLKGKLILKDRVSFDKVHDDDLIWKYQYQHGYSDSGQTNKGGVWWS